MMSASFKTIVLLLVSLTSLAQAETISATGLREVLWIDVYRVTLSTDKKTAQQQLAAWKNANTLDTALIKTITQLDWQIDLDLERDLSGQEVAEAIQKALQNRLPNREQLLADFIQLLKPIELLAGDQLKFRANGSGLSIEIAAKLATTTLKDTAIGAAFAAIYLDDKAIVDGLTQQILKQL